MARPKAKAPSLRYHLSGQSIVTIDGRDFYLGKHDSPESLARYAVLIATYQTGGLKLTSDFDLSDLDDKAAMLLSQMTPLTTQQATEPLLMRHLTASYRELIKTKYAANPAELHRLNQICNETDANEGDKLIEEYGPLALQRQRQRWIDAGNSRAYCNRLANAVVRMFKYGVSQELVKPETWQRLKSVEPLRIGQTLAPETEPIKPVAIEVVRKTAEHLSPVIKAMLRVQVATGMRPSEICRLRPCDIDRTGDVWMFRPAKHKTASRGKRKAVPILGDAREAITDYLNRDPQACCFSPRESVAWFRANQRASRQSKVQPSQQSRATEKPIKQPRESFDAHSFRQSIQRAAKLAGVPKWHPYQLRHLAGTVVRDALGIEAAQALLGHSHAAMTEHYAKQSESKAIEAANAAPKL
jgi:integrase